MSVTSSPEEDLLQDILQLKMRVVAHLMQPAEDHRFTAWMKLRSATYAWKEAQALLMTNAYVWVIGLSSCEVTSSRLWNFMSVFSLNCIFSESECCWTVCLSTWRVCKIAAMMLWKNSSQFSSFQPFFSTQIAGFYDINLDFLSFCHTN